MTENLIQREALISNNWEHPVPNSREIANVCKICHCSCLHNFTKQSGMIIYAHCVFKQSIDYIKVQEKTVVKLVL